MRSRLFASAICSVLLASPLWAQASRPNPQQPAAVTKTTAARKPAAPKSAPVEAAKPKMFTNEDVIKLQAAGFTEQEIVAAIEAAPNKLFDTSADGLIALKTAKLSGRVIAAVLGKTYEPEPPPVATPAPTTPITSTPAPPSESTEEKPVVVHGRKSLLGFIGISRGKPEEGKKPDQKLKNGEPAVVATTLSPAAATKTLKAFFENRNDLTKIEGDRISTEWARNRRCGIGNRCEDRVVIQISDNAGAATLRVRVYQRKHEGGINKKPWVEDGDSKGDLTAQLASELESFLGTAAASTTQQR